MSRLACMRQLLLKKVVVHPSRILQLDCAYYSYIIIYAVENIVNINRLQFNIMFEFHCFVRFVESDPSSNARYIGQRSLIYASESMIICRPTNIPSSSLAHNTSLNSVCRRNRSPIIITFRMLSCRCSVAIWEPA